MNKSLFQPSVPDAFSQVLPIFNIREMIPSYIPEGRQQAWISYSLCIVQNNCTTLFLILPLILFFYGLFARQYVVFDVCIFKKQKRLLHLCIVGAFVRFI